MTGLLRKAENEPDIPPIGVLPVGQMNHFSLMLLSPDQMPSNKLERAKAMAHAAMAVVKGKTEEKDVMKIQLIQSADAVEQRKPFYALSGFMWGTFNDILKKKDRYWLTGSLRTYTAFLFNGFGSSDVQWNSEANLLYTEPCSGCLNCYEKSESRTQKLHKSRWWSTFNAKETVPEYSKVLNPNCQISHEKTISTDELIITTNTAEGKSSDKPKMNIKFSKKDQEDSSFEFISNSWARLRSRNHLSAPDQEVVEARTVTILPKETTEDDREIYYSIDNEQYEVLPIKITLQPKKLNFFTQ